MMKMNDSLESVILVDENDQELTVGPKLETHIRGELHRAFSIFLFDEHGRTLIQKRADQKYHSAGKWANTCCGHPRPGENIADAAHRRLGEELGLDASLRFGFQTRYIAELDGDMIENELVHVFYATANAAPSLNPNEVAEVMSVDLHDLRIGNTVPVDSQAAWLRHYLGAHFGELEALRDAGLKTGAR